LEIIIEGIKKIEGQISVPGDKSISHRAIILGAIAQGETRVYHFLHGQDCLNTLECMSALGVKIEKINHSMLKIKGVGLCGLKKPVHILDAGNSGTTIRLLTGLLSGQYFNTVITGDNSLRKRPMKRVTQPLSLMGAKIRGENNNRFAPLSIKGSKLNSIKYTLPVASAQVKSALLIAGLFTGGETVITEPQISRDHTERMLTFMKADIQVVSPKIKITGKKVLQGAEIFIPGDISSAAYFLAAASARKGSGVIIKGVGVNPTRMGIIEILKKMGAVIKISNVQMKSNEPRADIKIEGNELVGIEINREMIGKLIDELPLIAVLATQARGKTVVSDAKELRLKETDRITAIVTELKKMGASITEKEDGFEIIGPTRLKGAVCKSYHDHRMAMSLAVAALYADGKTIIEDAECIDVSYPRFFHTLKKIIK
jgi:3-phosphoshikimate 1-carboxyvinyltransferase